MLLPDYGAELKKASPFTDFYTKIVAAKSNELTLLLCN